MWKNREKFYKIKNEKFWQNFTRFMINYMKLKNKGQFQAIFRKILRKFVKWIYEKVYGIVLKILEI